MNYSPKTLKPKSFPSKKPKTPTVTKIQANQNPNFPNKTRPEAQITQKASKFRAKIYHFYRTACSP